jgi:uncharacterized protein YjbJ (UPF0337 family)
VGNIDELKGKAKEAAGRATDDPDLEAEGRNDQAAAKLDDAKDKAKDAAGDVKDAFKS